MINIHTRIDESDLESGSRKLNEKRSILRDRKISAIDYKLYKLSGTRLSLTLLIVR